MKQVQTRAEKIKLLKDIEAGRVSAADLREPKYLFLWRESKEPGIYYDETDGTRYTVADVERLRATLPPDSVVFTWTRASET